MPKTDICTEYKGKRIPLPNGFDDYLDVKRTAIVEIDMHGGHLDPNPDCPCPNPRGRKIIKAIDAFNAECRKIGVPIIHIVNTYRAGDFEGVDSAWRRLWEAHLSQLPAELRGPECPYGNLGLEGTKWSRLVVEKKPEDYVVNTKKRVTAFETTDLDFLLKQLGKCVIVIIGIMSDCCDLCSAFYAGSKDYKVVYAYNLTRGSNEAAEQHAKDVIAGYVGLVINSDDLLEEWRAQ